VNLTYFLSLVKLLHLKMYSVNSIQSMLIFAILGSTAKVEASSADACDGNVTNHVEVTRHLHHTAIQKGAMAAKVWKVEQGIKAAKDVCIMRSPSNMPSLAERHPVKGDWVRTKSVRSRVCLPLRWPKYEDDEKCGWEMKREDKTQVLVTDGTGKFRLANPTDGRQTSMESWENWHYDNTVLVGIKETVTNLKADCEKVVFSLYAIETDIRDTSQQIDDLHMAQGDNMLNAQMKSREVQKFKDLQDKINIANERLELIHVLNTRYNQVCR